MRERRRLFLSVRSSFSYDEQRAEKGTGRVPRYIPVPVRSGSNYSYTKTPLLSKKMSLK
ncbi:hypothetical protein GS8_1058 [Geobacillus stearothermophilus]|uniref:Uncharacterized protein n=1 Tax=Geobacillus stearothermophilus TaxID=1422 RepID=A0ABQ7HH49_GEOSE|nr:hypothetical protein GS8_1058 [Geobacillus stearothermophilus]